MTALDSFLRSTALEPLTTRTITSNALRQDIARGRERNWYLNQGESIEEVTTISASFRWNTAVYIVTVAGPSSRLDPRLDQAIGLITGVCQLLEMRPDDPQGR